MTNVDLISDKTNTANTVKQTRRNKEDEEEDMDSETDQDNDTDTRDGDDISEEERDLPIDKGWAWVIMFGKFNFFCLKIQVFVVKNNKV